MTVEEVRRHIQASAKPIDVIYLHHDDCAALWREMDGLQRVPMGVAWNHQGMKIYGVPVKPLEIV